MAIHPEERQICKRFKVVSKYKSPTAGDAGLFPVVPLPTCPFAAVLCVLIAEDTDVDVANAAVSVMPCTSVVSELCVLTAVLIAEDVAEVVANADVSDIPCTEVVAELWLEIAAAVSVSVAKLVAVESTLATSLALVNSFYSPSTTSCQFKSSSTHLNIFPSSTGIAVGASQRHVASFSNHEAKGFGGINASRTESYEYPIPA